MCALIASLTRWNRDKARMAWDATHITAAAVSLIALAVLERGLGHSGGEAATPRRSSRSADEPSTIRPDAEQED